MKVPFIVVLGVALALMVLPVFSLLAIPFVLFRLAIKLVMAIVILPFMAVVLAVALGLGVLALCLAVAIPLVPVALGLTFVWAVVKLAGRGPATHHA